MVILKHVVIIFWSDIFKWCALCLGLYINTNSNYVNLLVSCSVKWPTTDLQINIIVIIYLLFRGVIWASAKTLLFFCLVFVSKPWFSYWYVLLFIQNCFCFYNNAHVTLYYEGALIVWINIYHVLKKVIPSEIVMEACYHNVELWRRRT